MLLSQCYIFSWPGSAVIQQALEIGVCCSRKQSHCRCVTDVFDSRIPSKIIAKSLLGLGSISRKWWFSAIGRGAEQSLSPLSLTAERSPKLKIMLCLPVIHCTNTLCVNIKFHGNSKTFKVISNCRFDCDICLICHPFCKIVKSAFWNSS